MKHDLPVDLHRVVDGLAVDRGVFELYVVGLANVPPESSEKRVDKDGPGWVLLKPLFAVALQLNAEILNTLCYVFHSGPSIFPRLANFLFYAHYRLPGAHPPRVGIVSLREGSVKLFSWNC